MQENHSRSGRGILRGLHFQTQPGQAKLVRCLRGAIWDVAVDLRRDSPTYRALGGPRARRAPPQLFVPRLRARILRAQRAWPTSPTSCPATTTPPPRPESPGTTPRSASSGRSPTRCSPTATDRASPRRDRRLAALVARRERRDPARRARVSRSAPIRKIGGLSAVRSETAKSTPLARSASPSGAGSRRRSRAHACPGDGLAADRRRGQHADLRAHRVGQDAGRLPVGDRPAVARARSALGAGACGSSTCRRSRPSPTTSSATCARR